MSVVALDKRLGLCAKFVRKDTKLADIGTDHAYLPVWLCSKNICKSAIASDINTGPLEHAKETISNANLQQKVTVRLCNGLNGFSTDECDDVVIAGMGGELISEIIENCCFSHDKSKHFIVQPMTKSEYLVEWLYKNGYEIIQQDCCVASKKCYTVMLVVYTGNIFPIPPLFKYIAKLSPETNSTHALFVSDHIERLYKQAKGNKIYDKIAKQLEEIINDFN